METIVSIATPVFVFAATWIVRKIGPKIPGVVIVGVIVPVLSGLVTAVSYYAGASPDVIVQVALGLVAVFLAEVVKQWKQGVTP